MPRDVDLNLLRALEAIVDEQSVTKAAQRLGLSQPAMSAALAKLRRHFHDDLLVRVGNTYEPTALARDVLGPTSRALQEAQRAFFREDHFDPATTERTFSVVMSDYATTVLGPPVMRRMRAQSPKSRLDIHTMGPWIVDGAPDSLRMLDLLVLPHGFVRDLPYRDLFEDDWVCIVSADQPVSSHELTVESLEDMGWVTTFDGGPATMLATQQLRARGVQPRMEVVTENFLTVGPLVEGSTCIALVQERLAQLLARSSAIRILPCPFEATPLVESMWWHPMFEDDPAHAWLRSLFIESAIEIQ